MSVVEFSQYSVIKVLPQYDNPDKIIQFIHQKINSTNCLDDLFDEDKQEFIDNYILYIYPTWQEHYDDVDDYREMNNTYSFQSSPDMYLILHEPEKDYYNVEIYNKINTILQEIQVGLREENWVTLTSRSSIGGTNYYDPDGKFVDVHNLYSQYKRMTA
jgi:hypothetical protein